MPSSLIKFTEHVRDLVAGLELHVLAVEEESRAGILTAVVSTLLHMKVQQEPGQELEGHVALVGKMEQLHSVHYLGGRNLCIIQGQTIHICLCREGKTFISVCAERAKHSYLSVQRGQTIHICLCREGKTFISVCAERAKHSYLSVQRGQNIHICLCRGMFTCGLSGVVYNSNTPQ